MKQNEAPCATKVKGGDCESIVFTHFARPAEQDWAYCDECVDNLDGDGTDE